MNINKIAFLGSLMKAEFLLKDTVIQPQQLESTLHQEINVKNGEVKAS